MMPIVLKKGRNQFWRVFTLRCISIGTPSFRLEIMVIIKLSPIHAIAYNLWLILIGMKHLFFNWKLVYICYSSLAFSQGFLYDPVTHKNKKVKVSSENAISDPNSHCWTIRPTLASVTSKRLPQYYSICSFHTVSLPDWAPKE